MVWRSCFIPVLSLPKARLLFARQFASGGKRVPDACHTTKHNMCPYASLRGERTQLPATAVAGDDKIPNSRRSKTTASVKESPDGMTKMAIRNGLFVIQTVVTCHRRHELDKKQQLVTSTVGTAAIINYCNLLEYGSLEVVDR
jgi:hypothetical protein